MTVHTPGPWTVRDSLDSPDYVEIDAPTWSALATVVVQVDHKAAPEGDANAAMIAAGPIMLAALRVAHAHSERRAASRAKWTQRDQDTHETIARAIRCAGGWTAP